MNAFNGQHDNSVISMNIHDLISGNIFSARAVIENVIFMRPQNLIIEVYVAMGLAYFVMLILCMFDILATKETLASRLIWSLLVVIIPVLGMYVFTVDSIFRADFAILERLGFGASNADKP